MEVATAAPPSLRALQELIEKTTGRAPFRPRGHLACSLFKPGFPRGAVSTISGAAKTECVVRFLAEHPELQVAWVEEALSVYPCGIAQRGGGLERILFVEAETHALWTVSQLLRSQIFQVIVFSSVAGFSYQEEKTLRGLQLAAEKAGVSVILLSDRPQQGWAVSLLLRAERTEGEVRIEVLRQRG
jgi:hypothetical protein